METIKVNMSPNPLDVQTIHASQNDGEARQWEFELHNNGELIDTSEVTEQMFFKAYKGGTEEILPTNGSVPTTAPFLGDIRYPQGLLTDQEFTYRQNPTESDGLAKITDIKGNTLVWNQLVQNGNFADGINYYIPSAATITASDGILTITKNQNTGSGVGYIRHTNLNFVLGHKYFARVDYKGLAGKQLAVFSNSLNAGMTQFTPTDENWHTIYRIFTANVIPSVPGILWLMYETTTDDNVAQFRNYAIFDLTEMFGSGNEPSTVEEFTSLFSKPYYDYCKGALLSFGGRNVKFNQLQQSASASRTINGITYTVNNDGSITANGTATATSIFYLRQIGQLYANHKYFVKGCPSGGTAQTYMLAFRCNIFSTTLANDIGDGAVADGQNYSDGQIAIRITSGVTLSNATFMPQLFDLSEMFGIGNEPSAEGFKELFPDDYYEYTTGQYMNIGQPVGLKTVGKNLFDGIYNNLAFANTVAEDAFYKGFTLNVSCLKGKRITVSRANTTSNNRFRASFFSVEPQDLTPYERELNGGDQYYTYDSQLSFTLIVPNGANYLLLYISNVGTEAKDLMIEIGSSVSDYEPYTSSTLSLPVSTYFPTGMKSAGSVYDELTPRKAITRIGAVDLGSLPWARETTTPSNWRFYAPFVGHKKVGTGEIGNIVSSKYSSITANQSWQGVTGISLNGNANSICICDMGYSDAESIKASLQGVYFYYELATPTETPFTTASLVTENAEIPLSNEDGVLIGKCTEQLSENPGFIDAKIKLSDSDGTCYSNKLQLHVERSPQ